MGFIDESTRDRLIGGIGKYDIGPAVSCLSEEGRKELFMGIDSYESARYDKVAVFFPHLDAQEIFNLALPQVLFREQLMHYLYSVEDIPLYTGDPEIRATEPEKALVSMKELLGPDGVNLYKLALEEEANSEAYRMAWVIKSTRHVDGPQWKQRPVLIVAGPSGCGKSTVAETAMEYVEHYLPKYEGSEVGNDIITVDGGSAREVSQIRKLVIQIANKQGYCGISDLQEQSGIIEKLKPNVQKAAFITPGVGVVIPETFSKWINPMHPIRDLMKHIDNLKDTKQIFVRIEGEEPTNFQRVVAYMGSRRAWKTSGFDKPLELDLNQKDITESKAYNPKGFVFGESGSMRAAQWYQTHSRDKLYLVSKNDLILLKFRGVVKQGVWTRAVQGEQGDGLFSRRVYEDWLKKRHAIALKDYYHSNNLGFNIQTSGRMEYGIALNEMDERIKSLKKGRGKDSSKKIKLLDAFIKQLPKEIQDDTDIHALKTITTNFLSEYKKYKEASWRSIFFSKTLSKTLSVLNNIDKALDAMLRTMPLNVTSNGSMDLRGELEEIKHSDITTLITDPTPKAPH